MAEQTQILYATSKKRIYFAKQMRNMDENWWNRVIFTDECSIQINPGLAMKRDKRFHHTNPYDPKYTHQKTKYAT